MIKDFTLITIFKELAREAKDKFNIDLTVDEIHELVEAEFKVIPEAFKNEDTVKLDYFGKFKIKKGRKEAFNYVQSIKNDDSLDEDTKNRLLKTRGIMRVQFGKPKDSGTTTEESKDKV